MSSRPQAPRMRATMRRVKAGGERFLGGVLPGATARRLHTRAFADEWAAANLEARAATGPLWIVLGDSTGLGLGATTREAGYVGVAHEMLRHREAWRVVNLSHSGAGIADVLARQLPDLAALTEEEPAALVSCVVGTEDVARRTPGLDITLRSMLVALPKGTVVATVPLRDRMAHVLNAVIREEAQRHRLRVVELPPVRGAIGRGRDAVRLGDVGHAAWAGAFMAAVDRFLPEAASGPSKADTPPHGLPVITAPDDVRAEDLAEEPTGT